MAERVLISGGNGMVGKYLKAWLTTKGYEVGVLSRKFNNDPQQKSWKWNVDTGELDVDSISGCDHIIHLAGANLADKKWSYERKREILDSRVKSTELLYNSLKDSVHSLKTFISASAIGYYGWNTGAILVDEERKKPGDDFLSVVVKEWESSVNKISTLGVRTVVLRFGLVLDSKGGVLKKLLSPSRLGLGAALGNGEQYMSWIHIHDLCEMILFTLRDKEINGIFNAVAPEPVTNKQMMKTIAGKLGKPFFMPDVPAFVLRIMFGERASMILGGNRVSCAKIESKGFSFKYKNIDQALNDLIKK